MKTAVFENFDIDLTEDEARKGGHMGPCDADIAELLGVSHIEAQLNQIGPEKIAQELKRWGAWEAEDLQDADENRARILWLACGNILDEL